jgi:hypothetical protein
MISPPYQLTIGEETFDEIKKDVAEEIVRKIPEYTDELSGYIDWVFNIQEMMGEEIGYIDWVFNIQEMMGEEIGYIDWVFNIQEMMGEETIVDIATYHKRLGSSFLKVSTQ